MIVDKIILVYYMYIRLYEKVYDKMCNFIYTLVWSKCMQCQANLVATANISACFSSRIGLSQGYAITALGIRFLPSETIDTPLFPLYDILGCKLNMS